MTYMKKNFITNDDENISVYHEYYTVHLHEQYIFFLCLFKEGRFTFIIHFIFNGLQVTFHFLEILQTFVTFMTASGLQSGLEYKI